MYCRYRKNNKTLDKYFTARRDSNVARTAHQYYLIENFMVSFNRICDKNNSRSWFLYNLQEISKRKLLSTT